MAAADWKPGDWAIYLKQKHSSSPGPRAKEVYAATSGETYSYVVEKYWVVQEILAEGTVRLRTRRGKDHVIAVDDPRLRKPRWWERWLLAARFAAIQSSERENDSLADTDR